MNTAHLNPTDFARKAVAPSPACVTVASGAPAGAMNVLIYALKDLEKAGIVARLVVAGAVSHEHGADLSGLARRLGVENRVHLVHDTGDFTLSRVFLFSQYLLTVGLSEDARVTREAVRCGCIPIARDGGDTMFFDRIERVIRATFGDPVAYAKAHESIAETIDE